MFQRKVMAAVVMGLAMQAPMQVRAQGAPEREAPPRPPVGAVEWARLRRITQALGTEEASRKFYLDTPTLGDTFPLEAHFLDLVAKWRPRVSPLPERWEDRDNLDLEARDAVDGSRVCSLTFHHETPQNAITILKTVWRDGALTHLAFMKGFTNIPYDNAARNRELSRRDDHERQVREWTAARSRSTR